MEAALSTSVYFLPKTGPKISAEVIGLSLQVGFTHPWRQGHVGADLVLQSASHRLQKATISLLCRSGLSRHHGEDFMVNEKQYGNFQS